VQLVDADAKPSAGHAPDVPVQVSATSHWPAEDRHTVLEDAKPSAAHVALEPVQFSATSQSPAAARQTVAEDLKVSAGQVALVPVQFSATSQSPAAARHTVPAFPAGCVHAGALTVPLHMSVVHGLPSSVQPVPAALTVLGGQFVPGESAMSWLMSAVFPVDAFAPVTPAIACDASALSEAASVELEVSAWNRSVMPDGAPIGEPSARPKQATSIALATVVVIDGVEPVACPSKALIGAVVSTLKYALIPPATREAEMVKT